MQGTEHTHSFKELFFFLNPLAILLALNIGTYFIISQFSVINGVVDKILNIKIEFVNVSFLK